MKRSNALVQQVCDVILDDVKSGKIVLVIGVTTSKKRYRYYYTIKNMRTLPLGVKRIYKGCYGKDYKQMRK